MIVYADFLKDVPRASNFLEVEGGARLLFDVVCAAGVFGQVAVGGSENHWPVVVARAATDWLGRMLGWGVDVMSLRDGQSIEHTDKWLAAAFAGNRNCGDVWKEYPIGTEPVGFDLPGAYIQTINQLVFLFVKNDRSSV